MVGPSSSLFELEQPRFGEVVRQLVALRSDELSNCLDEQRLQSGQRNLGRVLLGKGLISRQQVFQVLQFQARWVANAMRADLDPNGCPCPVFLSLCLPAFNEEANIEDTLDAARAMLPEFVERFEVVVVDDGSTDATATKVEAHVRGDARVRLVRHARNLGYGAAVSSALRAARGDLVMFTDSDGQFTLLDLPRFLVEIRNADAVVGYRRRRADPWHRRFNAWSWNRLVRLAFGVGVRDLDCAFKLFRRETVAGLELTTTGAAINAEIMVQCARKGLKIRELPVQHFPRCHGSPTGAALKVILRAFRELPGLWKYRTAVGASARLSPQPTR